MSKSRLEAITDGIIAIAATIMVLELAIPPTNDLAGLKVIGHTFLAYIISFFMIYIVWSMHHDLFREAEVISKRTFMVNGIWIFILTLVPFTTEWVGTTPYAFLPEFFYALNLLLWNAAFHWLDHQMRKDNPDMSEGDSGNKVTRMVLYIVYILCIILASIKPEWSIYVIGLTTVFIFFLVFREKKKES